MNAVDFDRPLLLDIVKMWLAGNELSISSMGPVSHEHFSRLERSEDPADVLSSLKGR